MFVLNASLTGVLLAVVPIVAVGAVQYGVCEFYNTYVIGFRVKRLIQNKNSCAQFVWTLTTTFPYICMYSFDHGQSTSLVPIQNEFIYQLHTPVGTPGDYIIPLTFTIVY